MPSINKTSKSAHPTFYLTLMGVMQSLALGYLLQVLSNRLQEFGGWQITVTLESITMFIILVITWHEYAMGTLAFTWRIRIFDSLIPFLIGSAEYFIITCITTRNQKGMLGFTNLESYLLSIVFFLLCAIIAYANQLFNVESSAEYNQQRRISLLSTFACVFTMILVGLFWAIIRANPNLNNDGLPRIIIDILLLVLFLAHAIRIEMQWKRVP